MNCYPNKNKHFFSNCEVVHLSPADIKFSQDSVAMSFQDKSKKNLNQTCEEIALGEIELSDFPRIRVTKRNGKYYR